MCACLWLGNMPDSGITITCDDFFYLFFGTREELPFATLGISLSLSLSPTLFFYLYLSHKHISLGVSRCLYITV